MAICPQDIHASFLLVSQNREIEARKVIYNSLSVNATDVDFISDQFVNWVAKRPSQMSDTFNKSAYYVVNGEKNLAKNAITDYFYYEHPEISEFAWSFVAWGTELMEVEEALNHKER